MAATARNVDLTNVKEGGNFRPKRKPEGDYKAKIVKADDHQPNDKTKPMGWVLTIQVDGDARASYPYYLSPEAKQAWKVAGICRAAGLNVKNVRVKFDPNKLVNKSIGVALADDEYEGRPKSVIDDVFPASEVDNAPEDETEEVEDIDTDAEDEVYDDEPEEDEEPEEEEPPPPPVRKRRAAKPAPEPEPEPEDDEDEEEDEEPEPEPAPVRRRRAKPPVQEETTPVRRRAKPKPAPVEDDDDLDDLDTDDL